ncbi:inosine/xanthosine triphosphatase [Roseisolibacter sp. H3M3-2]|uniref:inosine/xanthosine triphosphatase n=1 Tax=Roseisolibacter sp. H3M3-2 TaxID=3031323 RepID=UPI0023DAD3AC|nr:inosine/xanthosine triphosphatase [Roseisolibacter sp. H3M3-2]MDF1503573.1 inosine/xanthosine triphosphatase [Roseisolibacter sp. H3M3-2]
MPDLSSVRRVAVGSTNPVKVAAARAVLARVAPGAEVVGVAVASGVPDQPWGDDETRRGAVARARAALRALDADLGVGFEGGVVAEADGAVRSCAWAAVVDAAGVEGVGGSMAMPLPAAVARRLRAGEELAHAIDALTGERGTKHRGGAVAVLTAGLVDRRQAYEVILAYALAPFLAPAGWDL